MFDTTDSISRVGAPQASTKCSALYLIEVLRFANSAYGFDSVQGAGKNRSWR